MLGLAELKNTIIITDSTVECPVKGCPNKVRRRRRKKEFGQGDEKFKCPKHKICISPSTFRYESMWDNIIWNDQCEKQLWDRIKTVKRESRMAHDNSEDAVTWNVFRFLARSRLLGRVLTSLTEHEQKVTQIIYWAYSPDEDGVWDWLRKARQEFELVPSRGSEPDMIVTTSRAVFFIEAKLTAGNKTLPPPKADISWKYKAGGDSWFNQVFASDFDTVAVRAKKYEFMRFWLLGSWIAKEQDLEFYLVNLVRSQAERNIENEFCPHIRSIDGRRFMRLSWERIFSEVLRSEAEIEGRDTFEAYVRNKSIGYINGRLQAAFIQQATH